jgi:16S rRNA (adenine1518-N6/adenine1519-N6)-dimethyltransferase
MVPAFLFHPKKSQNFLINNRILDKIIETAYLKKNDIVLEIGAGTGILTSRLAEKAGKVFSLEIDKTLTPILKNNLAEFSNVSLIFKNIKKVDLSVLGLLDRKYKLVANLPYSITGYVLRRFLGEKPRPEVLVLMLQEEVGKRITAQPPKMSKLSLACQFYGKPQIVLSVGRENFWPQPKVDSVLIKIELKKKLPSPETEKYFFSLIKAGFLSPRKYLINNLVKANIGDKEQLREIFKKLNLDFKIRPAELSLENWLELTKIIFN